MKFFVKYNAMVPMSGRQLREIQVNKFFTTDDIEEAWNKFSAESVNEVHLVDITIVSN